MSPDQLQAQLAAIVASSDDAIVSKDLNSIVQSWNQAAERIFGYTAEEMIGQSITKLMPPDRVHEEADIISKIRCGERVNHFHATRIRKDGRPIEMSVTISPVKDATGEIIGASKVARDITESNRILRERDLLIAEQRRYATEREQLLEAERAARSEAERVGRIKDEFLATLSHELRTPLSAMLGWSQLLKADQSPETLEEGLAVIERNARLQTQLIEDLLDMSRIVSGKIRLDVQFVDLSAVINASVDLVKPAADAKSVRLHRVLDSLAGPVSGDPNRLQQIVSNLLSNAIKFTPRGGKVEILLERVNSHVEVTVTDTGQGIAPEFLPHVFDRFRQADASTTRNFGGLGLGLSIVKQLVELHGGTVRAMSAGEGQGATFSVALPLAVTKRHPDERRQRTESSYSPSHEDLQVSFDGMCVLVVDDESDARDLIERFLVERGARVLKADTAEAAIAKVQAERPDIIISDIGMPHRDGYDLIRSIRALPADAGGRTPAIALTAFARSEDRTRAMMAGYQVHLSKPVEPSELIATVAGLAGRTN